VLKKVLNLHEEAVSQRLRAICDENGASVYAKVRVADVLPIENSGISNEEYSYALKSHFDFVVADSEHNPLFAVEFDGPSHDSLDQTVRDTIKNRLAERFALPLLRVRSAHLLRRYDGWDLLSWIVDVWFLREEADRMYANGELPYDFDFDPALIISSPNRKRCFPYWLGLDAQLKIQDLQKKGAVLDMVPSTYHGVDDSETHRALAFLRIDREVAVFVTTAMRSQQMRLDLSEPIRGVLFHDLYHQLMAALADPSLRVPLIEIDRVVKEFAAAYKMLSWGGYCPPEEGVKRD
jgi:Protein of unknown function (DUF2726)